MGIEPTSEGWACAASKIRSGQHLMFRPFPFPAMLHSSHGQEARPAGTPETVGTHCPIRRGALAREAGAVASDGFSSMGGRCSRGRGVSWHKNFSRRPRRQAHPLAALAPAREHIFAHIFPRPCFAHCSQWLDFLEDSLHCSSVQEKLTRKS